MLHLAGAGLSADWTGWSVGHRTRGDPSALVADVRRQIAELDKDLPLGAITTMRQFGWTQIATPLIEMFVLGFLAGWRRCWPASASME